MSPADSLSKMMPSWVRSFGYKMKEIPLTQGKIALIDDEDYDKVSSIKWYAIKHHRTFYARSGIPKKPGQKWRGYITLHSEIMQPPVGHFIDHIDGNGLNCCRNNLRICTSQQNSFNRKPHIDSRSKYKGVSVTYKAKITKDGIVKYLGSFNNEKEAAIAYDMAARELFGEFAKLNFPDDPERDI